MKDFMHQWLLVIEHEKCWKFGIDNCYVFHMGLIKLDLDCIVPFFFNPAIKQTNNNKKKELKLPLLCFIYIVGGCTQSERSSKNDSIHGSAALWLMVWALHQPAEVKTTGLPLSGCVTLGRLSNLSGSPTSRARHPHDKDEWECQRVVVVTGLRPGQCSGQCPTNLCSTRAAYYGY